MVTRPLPQAPSRTWATLLHLFGLVGFFLTPLGVVLPLIVWSALRHRDPGIDLQGRLALNFQLSMLVYLLVGTLLLLLMSGVVIVVFVAAAELYCGITAVVHAAHGDTYAYPLSLRFLPAEAMPGGLHAA